MGSRPLCAATLRSLLVAGILAPLLAEPGTASSGPLTRNGFRLEPASIPVEEILPGGPRRDGIPALDHPEAVSAADSPWRDDQRVLGVEWRGASRAYPIAILDWHELVNDTLGGRPLLVSYCPLCGTGIVFDRAVGGEERRFGVSGLLYRSDLLMYDRETESLWSQISARAVTGPLLGSRLELVRSTMTRWDAWRDAHPDTTVLSRKTGYRRNYDRSPYGDYATSTRLVFPAPLDRRYHPKERTVGLRLPDGRARAYPAREVQRAGGIVEERFAGQPVRVAYASEKQSFQVEAPSPIEVVEGFWFAWAAFHPDTTVFVSPGVGESDASRGSRRSEPEEESLP